MINKHFKTTGIIIRKVDFGDADRIVTILSDDHGKIDCVAKGARRIKSRFCGRLELFNHVQLNCFQGRELACINEAYLHEGFTDVKDMRKLSALFYMAEITNKLIQSGQCAEVAYRLLIETLRLIRSNNKTEILTHTYIIKLLTNTGFLSSWNGCARCNAKFDENSFMYLSLIDKGALCGNCKTPEDIALELLMVKWVNYMQKYPISDIIKVRSCEKLSGFVRQWLFGIMENLFGGKLKTDLIFSL